MDGREHDNALNRLWNFISADYETRLARSGKLNDFIDGGMDYFLGPTGIPNKARAANTMMNPIAQMGQAGADATVATDPRYSRDERINAGVNALTGSLATLAPAAFMKAAGRPAADAVMETLVNTSRPLAVDGISDAARRFAVSEDGSFPAARAVDGFDDIKAKYPDVDLSIRGSPESGFTLSKIVVPEGARSQGVGSRVMAEIIQRADDMGAQINLTPSSDFGGNKRRLTDFYRRSGFVPNKGRNRDFSTMEDMYRTPQAPASTPAAPTGTNALRTMTPQQEMAERILEMRAAGNAADVTDEMMAMADDVTMFNNTPLPMDEASRMARAQEAGFDAGTPLYHGTGADFDAYRNNRRGNFFSDSPEIADIYASGSTGGSVRGQSANAGPNIQPVMLGGREISVSDIGPDGGHGWSTDNLAKTVPGVEKSPLGTYPRRLNEAAQREGFDRLRIDDMLDLGGEQTQWMSLNPETIRSRFARFDPEFAHLGNLSAGVAGLGVVGLGARQDQQTDDPYAQRNTLADVMRPAFGNALNGYTPPLPRNALQRGF
jgi:GNAT superfamily N-acetyltransferase